MATFQDVLRANLVFVSWAFTESSGFSFVPWIGAGNLAGSGTILYQQTGPFSPSFALHLAANASIRSGTLPYVFGGPTHHELWFKLDSATVPANLQLIYVGNIHANGYGLLLLTTNHLALYFPGSSGIIDTGAIVADTAWHHVSFGTLTASIIGVGLDGKTVFNGTNPSFTAPSPNTLGYGCNSADGAAQALSISYPALFLNAYSDIGEYADNLAATDPTNALAQTATYPSAGLNPDLTAILNAVRKTFPTT